MQMYPLQNINRQKHSNSKGLCTAPAWADSHPEPVPLISEEINWNNLNN